MLSEFLSRFLVLASVILISVFDANFGIFNIMVSDKNRHIKWALGLLLVSTWCKILRYIQYLAPQTFKPKTNTLHHREKSFQNVRSRYELNWDSITYPILGILRIYFFGHPRTILLSDKDYTLCFGIHSHCF